MGYSIGYDTNWKRDVGYGVPSVCDYPGCQAIIDRGLGCVCGGDPLGGEHGCGLYFCGEHLQVRRRRGRGPVQLCERCAVHDSKGPFEPTPDLPEWIAWKLADESWATWRLENLKETLALKAKLAALYGVSI